MLSLEGSVLYDPNANFQLGVYCVRLIHVFHRKQYRKGGQDFRGFTPQPQCSAPV